MARPADDVETTTLRVRVRPGSSRVAVGGRYGDAPDAPLLVAVTARAVDGAATDAVLRAVADALGLRRHQVALLRGATSRDKVLEIRQPPEDLSVRLAELGAGSAR